MTFPAESINITKPESALTSCNVVRSDVSTVKDTSLFVEANVENNIKSSNICIFVFSITCYRYSCSVIIKGGKIKSNLKLLQLKCWMRL